MQRCIGREEEEGQGRRKETEITVFVSCKCGGAGVGVIPLPRVAGAQALEHFCECPGCGATVGYEIVGVDGEIYSAARRQYECVHGEGANYAGHDR